MDLSPESSMRFCQSMEAHQVSNFIGNLDFPKINRLKTVCSNVPAQKYKELLF